MMFSNTLFRRCVSTLLAVSAMSFVAVSAVAVADEPSPNDLLPPGAVKVSDDVRSPSVFTLDSLRQLPTQTEKVTFATESGQQTHTYTGCSLDAIITAADPNVDVGAKHPLLTIAIRATGADGYSAALAWAEASPTLTPRPALVAYAEDGNALDQPRLVVPGDLGGARYVKDLTELQIVNLAHR